MSAFVGRAVVIRKNGGPEVLEIDPGFQFPAPEADEVLIKAAAFSVNPIDVIVRIGVYGPIPQNPTVNHFHHNLISKFSKQSHVDSDFRFSGAMFLALWSQLQHLQR
jgi:hypothetical protein